MSRTPALLLALALAVTLAAGCTAALNQPAPEKRYYVLKAEPAPAQPAQPQPALAPTGKGVLKVRQLMISPAFDSTSLIYKTGENSFQSDYYNVFLTSPAKLATEATAEYIKNSGLFAYVVGSGSDADPDFVLEGNLVSLYGDFSRKNPSSPDGGAEPKPETEPGAIPAVKADDWPVAVIKAQFFLYDVRDFDYKIILDADYSVEEPVTQMDAPGVVAAMNRALGGILSRLDADMAKAVQNAPAAADKTVKAIQD